MQGKSKKNHVYEKLKAHFPYGIVKVCLDRYATSKIDG